MNSALRSLTAAWPWTTADLLSHLWQSSAVGLAVLVLLWFGRGLSARTRRALGGMALLKFILPTGFLVNVIARLGTAPAEGSAPAIFTRPMLLPAFAAPVAATPEPAALSLGAMAMILWMAGSVALMAWWLVRGRVARRRILAEAEAISPGMERSVAAAAARLGLAEVPRCLAVGGERAPGVLGVLAPIVILPRGLEATLAPAELESVLLHELIHVQRRDALWGAAQALLVCLFWYHPLVWWLDRRLGLEVEQSCDERVLELTGDADAYAGGIVKTVQHALGALQPGLIGATTPPVVTRIKNIFAQDARRDRPFVRGAVLAGGALLLAFSGYAGSFAAPALALPPAATPIAAASEPERAAETPVANSADVTLSVDFPDEDIGRVLRNVADLFHLTVVMPVDLSGRTTVKLRDATWRQIYRAVLTPIGYTFVEGDDSVKVVRAEPVSVAMASLPALATETRLIAQADALKRHADELRQEVDAYRAARPAEAEGQKDPHSAAAAETAAKDAAVAAIDARRRALEVAAVASTESAQLAELSARLAAEREQERARADKRAKELAAEAERQRALAAEENTQRQDAASARSKAQARLDAAFAAAVLDDTRLRLAKSEADEARAAVGRVFEPNQLDRGPAAIWQSRPDYPFALRRAGIAGEATIDFIVTAAGDVVGAYAVKFTQPEFAQAAIAAVVRWKFKPGRRDGAAVATHLQVPIVFALNEEK